MSVSYIDEESSLQKLEGARVLLRLDLNVPLSGATIEDTSRLDAAIPTLKYLLQKGVSRLTVMSHLGRPKGSVVSQLSLQPVGDYLAEKLREEIIFAPDCVGDMVPSLLNFSKTRVVLLENLRFSQGEMDNCLEFARTLARYGNIYVNDAFGCCHRKHASVYAINKFYRDRHFGGLLFKRELESLGKLLRRPATPFVVVMGGSKVEDKLSVVEALLPKVDKLLIGGAMAYPLLAAKGVQVGKSLCSERDVELARSLLMRDKWKKILLPVDHLGSQNLEGVSNLIDGEDLPGGIMGLDIGPKTLKIYGKYLKGARTIFWNGPMGLFENPNYAEGTRKIAGLLGESSAFTVLGGGDSLRAVNKMGLAGQIDHVSTGGGASLEFIEREGDLPGIRALKFAWSSG